MVWLLALCLTGMIQVVADETPLLMWTNVGCPPLGTW